MIGDSRPITLQVLVNGGTALSAKAVSLGLIVTELVINALKHAISQRQARRPDHRQLRDRRIGLEALRCLIMGSGSLMFISPSGEGRLWEQPLVKALAQDLDARVEIDSSQAGVNVSLTHTAKASLLSQTA